MWIYWTNWTKSHYNAMEPPSCPSEKRMKASVNCYLQDSETTREEVRSSPKTWGPNYRQRLKEMGMDDAYLYIQRIPSSAVHGDWSSLLRFHVARQGSGYVRKQPDSIQTAAVLNPIVIFTCEVIVDYAEAVHPDDIEIVRSARSLIATVERVEEATGDFSLEDVDSGGGT